MAASTKPKQLQATLRLLINAGAAKPAPPVGPALGQAGLNIMAFCKDFNAKTAGYKDGIPLRVKLLAYTDKSFEWSLHAPPTSWFIKQACGLARGTDRPGHNMVAAISLKHVYEIGKIKQKDMRNSTIEGACRCVISSCKSMGVTVVAQPEDAAKL